MIAKPGAAPAMPESQLSVEPTGKALLQYMWRTCTIINSSFVTSDLLQKVQIIRIDASMTLCDKYGTAFPKDNRKFYQTLYSNTSECQNHAAFFVYVLQH